MKKILRMILGAAFVLAMLGCAAYAEAVPVDGKNLVYNVWLDESTAEAPDVITLLDATTETDTLGGTVSVKIVKSDATETAVKRMPEAALGNLIAEGSTLKISIPAGYYASNIYMHRCATAAGVADKVKLAGGFTASKTSNELSKPAADFAELTDTTAFSGSYLSAAEDPADVTETVTLEIELRAIPEGAPDIKYSNGGLTYPETPIVAAGDSFTASEHTVLALTDAAVKSAAVDACKAFEGWMLVYPNGSRVRVAAGDVIKPYTDCTVEAQWRDVLLVTVRAGSVTKEYSNAFDYPTAEVTVKNAAGDDLTADAHYKASASTVSVACANDGSANAGRYPVSYSAVTLSYRDDTAVDFTDANKLTADKYYVNYVPAEVNITQIPLTITVESKTDLVYNGSLQVPPVRHSLSLLTDSAHKHKIVNESVTYPGARMIGEGTVNADVSKIKIVDGSNKDVTANYAVTAGPDATIKVLPRDAEVKITAKSLTKEYDGTALTASNEYASVSGLLSGDSVTVTAASGTASEPGATGVSAITTYKIMRGSTDVTNCYSNITLVPGQLTVSRRTLTLTAVSASKVYDGSILYADKLTGQGYTNGLKAAGLLSGHTLSGVIVTGSGTQAGTYATKVNASGIKITDASGNSVVSCYSVKTVEGKLTISKAAATPTPAATAKPTAKPSTGTNTGTGTTTKPAAATLLTITAGSEDWTYDGEAHTSDKFTASGLKDGDTVKTVTFTPASTITDAGRAKNEISTYEIVDKNGKAVSTSKYTVKLVTGTLTVDKAQLVVTASSGAIDYGAGVLATGDVTYSALANSSHTVEAESKVYLNNKQAEPTEVGTYDNKVYSCVVRDAEGNDVSRNYDMRYVNGTLTVRAAKTDSDHGRDTANDNTAVVVLVAAMCIAGAAVIGISVKLLIDNNRKKRG